MEEKNKKEKGEVAFDINRSRTYGHVWNRKENKSEVENTLTPGCFLNTFSCAQIGQSSFNAKANKSISSGSGEIVFASDRNSLYSESENTFTNISKSSKTSLNLVFQISPSSPSFQVLYTLHPSVRCV